MARRAIDTRSFAQPTLRMGALVAGATTFVLVLVALTAYGVATEDACITDPQHPVDERWSGSQRLTWWPPAAVRCDWTTQTDARVSWTIASWPLWLVYGAVVLAAVAAVWGWAARRR